MIPWNMPILTVIPWMSMSQHLHRFDKTLLITHFHHGWFAGQIMDLRHHEMLTGLFKICGLLCSADHLFPLLDSSSLRLDLLNSRWKVIRLNRTIEASICLTIPPMPLFTVEICISYPEVLISRGASVILTNHNQAKLPSSSPSPIPMTIVLFSLTALIKAEWIKNCSSDCRCWFVTPYLF